MRILKFLFIPLLFFLYGCGADITINQKEVLFEIKKGESIQTVSRRLKHENIINNPLRFQILAKLMRKDSNLKYGVYLITREEKYADIINKFSKGATYSIKVTIPEGSNIYQIADILLQKELVKKEDFLRECSNKKFLARYNLPQNATLEGYLYPDTYMIPLNYPVEKIIEMFLDKFDQIVDQKYIDEINKRGLTLQKILTMASIIEKEAKLEYEKPIIAGVYYNRLKQKIKLQADPTLIYALILKGEYTGDIRYRDFTLDSKYNTYKYYGLPPSPIANPGKTSILAAIYPADVDYLYFVARPDGSHQFSKTLKEHNQAVYQYQKLPAIERRKKRIESLSGQ